jgi:RNA polymerase sigma factor (TIGR02999 family)
VIAPKTVTMLLRDWRAGNQDAFDRLVPLVYAELQRLAGNYMRGERAGHSLRPNDLVAEAYVRLAEADGHPDFKDRLHFFAIASRTMRQILVDHARRRNRMKRGDGARPVTFDDGLVGGERPEELVALDEALQAFAQEHERKARIVELHYFGGLTQPEIAEVLEIHVNTVARDMRFAEAWLHRRLRE